MEGLVKEVNSASGLQIFNSAVITNVSNLPVVQEVMSRAFENYSLIFVGDKSNPKKVPIYMTNGAMLGELCMTDSIEV